MRARACARRVPPLAATLLGAMAQEHERAAGAWHAEWEPLTQALALTGGAAAGVREALDGLEVDADRMRANLDATGGLLLIASGRARAARRGGWDAQGGDRRAVQAAAAAGGAELAARVSATRCSRSPPSRRTSTPAALDALLDPATYLGATSTFVERALARAERELP